MVREAVCAGTWYPEEVSEIEKFLDTSKKPQKVIAGVCPHAGWRYSGKTAGKVYSSMCPTELYIIIAPNHYGIGEPVSVLEDDAWETPLGNLKIDNKIAKAIIQRSKYAKSDPSAHYREHSIEVQAPFIKYLNANAKIVPITMMDYRPDVCKNLGESIAQVLKENASTNNVTLIASTDMSHYAPANEAKELDDFAIENILKLNPDALLKVVKEKGISMCGAGPTAAVIWAAKELGAKNSKLIDYTNSGEATNEYHQVVSYAGVIIF